MIGKVDGDVEPHLESLLDHGGDGGHLGPNLPTDLQEGPGGAGQLLIIRNMYNITQGKWRGNYDYI